MGEGWRWAAAGSVVLLAACGGGGGRSAPTTTVPSSTTTTVSLTTTMAETSSTFSPSCGPAIHAAGIGVGHADDAKAVAADLVTLDRLAKAEPNPKIGAQISEVERKLGAVAIAATTNDVAGVRAAVAPLQAAVAALSSVCMSGG